MIEAVSWKAAISRIIYWRQLLCLQTTSDISQAFGMPAVNKLCTLHALNSGFRTATSAGAVLHPLCSLENSRFSRCIILREGLNCSYLSGVIDWINNET